jgi:predicted HicB family RNase H-like nuclease
MSTKNLEYYLGLKYDIIVHEDEFEGEKVVSAYCKELGKFSCYGRGDTLEEALQSFEETKRDFITYLYEEGVNIPEPSNIGKLIEDFSGVFNIRTSPVIHANLVSQAEEFGISMNLYVNQLLSGAVEKRALESITIKLLNQLKCQLEDHHYEVTRRLTYQYKNSHDRSLMQAKHKDDYCPAA